MIKHTTHRYSDEELQEFHNLIEQKLEKAHKELNYMRQQIIEVNQNGNDAQGGDWTDDSSSHTELEMLNKMVGRQQQFVRNLDNAILRIKNKTYGICRVSGKLIDKKRLMLVPHATQSIAAKEAQSKGPKRMVTSKRSTPKATIEKRKIGPKKIISKVIKKSTQSKVKNIVPTNNEWETENEVVDVPAYENPIMDLDMESLEKMENLENKNKDI